MSIILENPAGCRQLLNGESSFCALCWQMAPRLLQDSPLQLDQVGFDLFWRSGVYE